LSLGIDSYELLDLRNQDTPRMARFLSAGKGTARIARRPTLEINGDLIGNGFVASLTVGIDATRREAIETHGATLRHLPKYSPDLNPTEMFFRKLKACPRKAGEKRIPRLRYSFAGCR
jgi:transposase